MPEDLYKIIYAEDPPAGLSSDESMEMLHDVPLRKSNKMLRGASSSQLQLTQPQQGNSSGNPLHAQIASTFMAMMQNLVGQQECDIQMLQPKRRRQQKALEDGQVEEKEGTPSPSPPAVASPTVTPPTTEKEIADPAARSKTEAKISPKTLFKEEAELDAQAQAAIVEAAIEARQMKKPAANTTKEQQKKKKKNTKKEDKAEKPTRSNYLKKCYNVKHKCAITNYDGQLCQFGHVSCSKEELFSIADKAIERLNEGSLAEDDLKGHLEKRLADYMKNKKKKK